LSDPISAPPWYLPTAASTDPGTFIVATVPGALGLAAGVAWTWMLLPEETQTMLPPINVAAFTGTVPTLTGLPKVLPPSVEAVT
jgi:hypothetical protein